MRANEFINEAPLPPDWDAAQYSPGTTFKARLAYALERAKKLGAGSSRVAITIEYEGRPTVLKIAKNQKGLSQNSVEADILGDGYARQLGILIPIIDYDTQNNEPSWIHTELAQKTSEKQLCMLMHCESLHELVMAAAVLIGKVRNIQYGVDGLSEKKRASGMNEGDIETFQNYVNHLGDLASSFDLELGDFARAANWGIYNGKPVIIDAGYNSSVMQQYAGSR